MAMVALGRKIGSAFVVTWGPQGAVTRFAQEQGISRQWVYREAQQVAAVLEGTSSRQQLERLQADNAALRHELAHWQRQAAQSVVLDEDKQAELATVGQALGVTLAQCQTLLEVLRPGQVLSVPSLGRRTRAAGQQAGALLEVFDALARPQVREAAVDEIYVRAPALMMVEPESLCWVAGRLTAEVSGAAWAQEFAALANLEQVLRDGGTALAKGVALVNEQRHALGQAPLVDQGDHFHALRPGGVGLRQAEKRARKAWAAAEAAEQALATCLRQGHKATGAAVRASHAWRQAEQALDAWGALERGWQQTKDALRLLTPAGELNTRAQAEAVLAQSLSQLPDNAFAKTKAQLQQPEMLAYLDRVHDQLEKLPFPAELTQAALRQETLRQRPALLRGETPHAAALRGLLLVGAVVLGKADELGQQAVTAVRQILRRAYRASSLVECLNSVLRMQQAQHRKLTQGLLNLKRLYWNCHTFRTGRRRGTTPYQRLGVPWPKGARWWDVLKWTPEQLREKLSTTPQAA